MSMLGLSAMLSLNNSGFISGMQNAQEATERMRIQAHGLTRSISSMAESAKAKASAMGESFKSGLSVARNAFGDAGLASAEFLKGTIDIAAKSQKINMDLAQTIKSTGGAAGLTAEQVSKMADEFSKTTTFGAGAIKTGQNMLLTFTNIGKDVFPMATQSMLDLAQNMGGDIAGASTQLGKALDDPIKGITELTNIGVKFTEEQKKQIEVMQQTGNTAEAQKLMLAGLNGEFGGQAAAAAATYEGRLAQLSNTIDAIKGSIGAVLLPYMQKVVEVFLSVAQKVQNLSKPMIGIIAKVLATTAVFGTLIGGLGLFRKVLIMIVPQLEPLINSFFKLKGPIGIVIALFSAFAFAYTKNLGGFKTFVDGIVAKAVPVFNSLSNAIKDLINLGSISSSSLSSLGKVFGKNTATIATTLQGVRDSVIIFVSVLQGNFGKANGILSKWSINGSASLINFITTVKNLATGLRATFFAALGLITGDFKDFSSTLQDGFGLSSGTTSKIVSSFQAVRTGVIDALTVVKNVVSRVFGFLVEHSNTVINVLKLLAIGFAAVKIGIAIFNGIKIAVAAFNAIMSVTRGIIMAVRIAQLALNIAFMINPVGVIIAGIIAFIAVIVLLWTKSTAFRSFFIGVWTAIKTGVMGSVKELKTGISNTWNSIKATVVSVVNSIETWVINAWDSIKTGIGTAINAIKAVIITIWTGIKTAVIAIVTPIVNNILALWNNLKPGITTIFNGLKNIFGSIWNGIKNIVLGPILLIVDLCRGNFTKLGSDAKVIFNNLKSAFGQIWIGIKQVFTGTLNVIAAYCAIVWNGMVNIAKSIWSTLKSFFISLWDGIISTAKSIWNGLGTFLNTLWNGIKSIAISAWEGLKNGVITIVQDVWQGIVIVFTAVVNFFKNLPDTLYNLGVAIFNSLKNGAWSILSTIGSWIETGFNAVVDFFKNLPDKMLEFGKNFIQGFINGVNSMIDSVINKVRDVGKSIEKSIKEVLGIKSPSKVMHGVGNFVIQGLANGMDSSKHLVSNAATKIGKGLPNKFYSWGQDIPNSLANGISDNIDSTTNTVTDMANRIRRLIHFTKPDEGPLKDSDTYGPDMAKGLSEGIQKNTPLTTNATIAMATNIRNVISQLIKDSLTYGQQIVTSISKGVQDSTSNLIEIVKTLTDKIVTAFREGFGIQSPSRVMYSIGNYLMQGLINGMSNNDVRSFLKKQISSMIGSAQGAVGGNVTEWLTAAIALTGVPMSWLPALEQIAMHESSGNPMDINLYDINAQLGHPSKGLMQLIDDNITQYGLPGMKDIWNPIDNAAAAIRYIQSRYGSPYNTPGIKSMAHGGPYMGYALGTTYATPGYKWVGEHGPELMKMRGGEQVIDSRNSKQLRGDISIAKLADTIIVREDADIDKIATSLVKKLKLAGMNM